MTASPPSRMGWLDDADGDLESSWFLNLVWLIESRDGAGLTWKNV